MEIAKEINSTNFDPSQKPLGWLRTVRIGLQNQNDPALLSAYEKLDEYLNSSKAKYRATRG